MDDNEMNDERFIMRNYSKKGKNEDEKTKRDTPKQEDF